MEHGIVSNECLERFALHTYKMLIKRWIFDDPDEIEFSLFLLDLSQYFGIYLVAFALTFFYSWVRGDLKSWVKIESHLFTYQIWKQYQ